VNAVEFEHVSKNYPIYDKPAGRLWELLTPGTHSFHRDFQALHDVSFSVRRGEVFCIVGENGCDSLRIVGIETRFPLIEYLA